MNSPDLPAKPAPNWFTTGHGNFSDPRSITWKPLRSLPPALRPQWRAAHLQAQAMQVVAAQARAQKMSLTETAALCGMNKDRVLRLTRGDIWMTLTDAVLLGETVQVDLLATAKLTGDRLDTAWDTGTP